MNIIIWNYSAQPQAGLPIVSLALQAPASGGFLMSHFGSTGVTGFNLYSMMAVVLPSLTRLFRSARSKANFDFNIEV
jgi:hypothetical protein